MKLLNCELILQLIFCLAICRIRGQDWGQADQQGEIKATGLDWNQGMSQEETRAGKQSCIGTA